MKKNQVEEIVILMRAYPFIAAAYQFGSTIRGQEGPMSDVDIAILVDEEQAPSDVDLVRIELLLAYEIQRHLNVPEVDLITLNHQRLTLQHTVLRTGRLIYEADPKYRIRFMQKVIQAYIDFQPTLALISQFHTRGRLRRSAVR
jgi:predicted nucleotidyltransferase